MMKHLFWVALGGALGSMARFLVQRWAVNFNAPHLFPWGTFVVNITGCFIIGALWALSMKSGWMTENMKLFFMTGICGGFTTFSAFSLESISLLRTGKFSLFLIYSFGSLLLSFIATYSALKIFHP